MVGQLVNSKNIFKAGDIPDLLGINKTFLCLQI